MFFNSYLYRLVGWAARSIDFLPECRLFFPLLEAHNLDHTEKQQCPQVLVHPHFEFHSWEHLDHGTQWQQNLLKDINESSVLMVPKAILKFQFLQFRIFHILMCFQKINFKNSWAIFKCLLNTFFVVVK